MMLKNKLLSQEIEMQDMGPNTQQETEIDDIEITDLNESGSAVQEADAENYVLLDESEVAPDRLYNALESIRKTFDELAKEINVKNAAAQLVMALESFAINKDIFAALEESIKPDEVLGMFAKRIVDKMKTIPRYMIIKDGINWAKEDALQIFEKFIKEQASGGVENELVIVLVEKTAANLTAIYNRIMVANKARPAPALVEETRSPVSPPTAQTKFFSSYQKNPVKLWRTQYDQLQNEIMSLIANKFEGSEVSSSWKRYLQNVESPLFPVFTFPELFRRNWASQAQQQAIDPTAHATEVTIESLPGQWISDDQQKEIAVGRYTKNDLILLVNVLQDYNRHLRKPVADDYRRQIKASQVSDGQRWSSANADDDNRKARLGMGIV